MSCKEKKVEMEMESGAEKRREAEEAIRTEPEPERSNGPVHWLVKIKEKMRWQFNINMAVAVVLPLIFFLITFLWVAPVIITQNQKIALIEARLEREMKTRVNNENKKLLEHERKLAEVTESLRELLHEALARAAAFEEQHNSTMDRVSTLELNHLELSLDLSLTRAELNTTASVLQDTVEDLEERLRNTTARTVTLEEELDDVEREVATVNATKASREEVSQQVAQLDRDKVDRTEFQELSANVTSLAETSSRADEELQQELRELSESALNHTHYNQIQQALASKASQVEVELVANSTTTLLQRVEGIENTIMQVQWNISQLIFNLTRLSITIETKASKQDINALSGRVTSLEGSTVDKDTFQQLIGTVQGIQDTKADESDLNQLKRRVDSLSTNTATKSALNNLDTKLRDRISSSDGTHRGLSSRIGSNSGSISKNRDDISLLQMQSSSAAGLVVPWMTIITSSVPLVTACWTTYTY